MHAQFQRIAGVKRTLLLDLNTALRRATVGGDVGKFLVIWLRSVRLRGLEGAQERIRWLPPRGYGNREVDGLLGVLQSTVESICS